MCVCEYFYRKNSVAEVAPNIAEMLRGWNQVHGGDFVVKVHIEQVRDVKDDEEDMRFV